MKFTKKELAPLLKNPTAFLTKLTEDDLVALYQHLSYAYYNTGKPLVSDEIFDIVQAHLTKLHPKHPILKSVGAQVADDDKRKETLPIWMGSLDKIKSDPKQLDTFKNKFKGAYVVSEKLDGISALLVGDKLYTRGNGEIGQNISHLLKFINGIPAATAPYAVRGELIMSKEGFEKFGKGANARNTVAGLVNAKIPDLNIAKNTVFVAYQLIDPVMTPSKQMAALKRMNFRVVWNKVLPITFESLSELLVERKNSSDYEIDGLVVTHDAVHPLANGDNPESAFAFKHLLTQQTAEVVVTSVEWSLSKDGLIKPVVLFGPVHLSGVKIQRATGFNAEYIKSNKIGPGARLLITRSGDVIPYIMQVLTPASDDKGQLPSDREYTWVGKDIKVVGKSVEQDIKYLENFFDKLEIKGIRGGTVKKLFESGVTDVKKFLNLKETTLVAKIQWTIIKEAIDAIHGVSCVQLMCASNAFGQGFGERKLKAIAKAIPSVLDVKAKPPTMDEMLAVEGVSTITATKFITGLAEYKAFLKMNGLACGGATAAATATVATATATRKSKASAVASAVASKATSATTSTASKSPRSKKSASFADQVIVFTGFRNKAWEAVIENGGGEVGATITKKTTLLVAKAPNENTGKIKDAKAKGIPVMSIEEFEASLK